MAKKIFLLIFVLTFFVRLDAIKSGNFPFTTDQGRDMIDIRGIAVNHKPRLIGPTTSINGVFLGPFWYYFNLPPFLLGQGDPSAILVWQIAWYQIAGLLLFLFFRKNTKNFALFVSIFFLIMPLGFNTSRYSWNANAMPIFTAIFLLLIYLVKEKFTSWRAFLLGLIAGLSFQIEAAFGILFFPFSFLFLLVQKRKIKEHLPHMVGFLITLLPQAFFEIRHQFPLTHVLLSEIGGSSSLLGPKLSLVSRVTDRLNVFTNLIQASSHLRTSLLFPIFLVSLASILILLFRKQVKGQTKFFVILNLAFIIFSLLFYIAFPQALKNWYLLGLSVPIVFLYSASLSTLFDQGKIFKLVVIIIVTASLIETITAQLSYLKLAQTMGTDNKSSLKNEIAEIDWVYQHADGVGFRAYSYLSSIYDFPYQYLYWWRGGQKYGYRPNDVAYLPGQPEYIENRSHYFSPTRQLPTSEPTFLIIEQEKDNPVFETAWLGNFSKMCLVEKTEYPYGVEIRKLIKCPTK